MHTNADSEAPQRHKNWLPRCATVWGSVETGTAIEFGRFRVLLRRRCLLADGVPVKLGSRAFDLLLVLLEADGALVTKEELFNRVWPGIVVSEENLKVQIFILRRALGADANFIRTEFGRGYRFIGTSRWSADARSRQPHRQAKPRVRRALPQPNPAIAAVRF